MGRLEDRVAIITGAGSGIGRATARRFVAEGASVVLNDVEPAYLEELAGELPEGSSRAVEGDVSEPETAERLAGVANEELGGIDVLVNNVGQLHIKEITETSVEEWDRLMAVNVRGMFLCCRAVIPTMLAQGRGSIVNLGSIAAFIGQEMGGASSFAYNVTKAAARQLATSLATRYAAEGIRANSVCPGATRTKQVRHLMPDLSDDDEDAIWEGAGSELTPIGRVADPDEIAAAILFLASEDASYVTGAPLIVDGGYLAR